MTVALDAVTSNTQLFGGSPFSFTHTPVGTPTAVGVFVSVADNSGTVTGVTYGGIPMTLAVSTADGAAVYIFGLASPPSGPQTVSVSFSPNPFDVVVGVVTVTGSDPATCFSATNSVFSGGAPNPATLTVASANGELVVDIFGGYVVSGVTVGPSPQVQQWNFTVGNESVGGSSVNAVGPTTTQWTMTSTNPNAFCSASFKLGPSGIPQPTWAEVVLGG